jgi:hypothetical protein
MQHGASPGIHVSAGVPEHTSTDHAQRESTVSSCTSWMPGGWTFPTPVSTRWPRRSCPPFSRTLDRTEDVIQLFAEACLEELRAHHDVTALREASFRKMAALQTAEGDPMRLNFWIVSSRVLATS